jgi:hypothetical protein
MENDLGITDGMCERELLDILSAVSSSILAAKPLMLWVYE